MFMYLVFFVLNIIAILIKITNQKDIYSLVSSNNTLLNFSENNINNDIQLLGISYNDVKGIINFIRSSPKKFADYLIKNKLFEFELVSNLINKMFDKEEYLNLIIDIKNITVKDNQTKKIIIELFDDIEKNKSSLDYFVKLINNTNGFKEILNLTFDFVLYNENIFKNIINIIKRWLFILNDVLCKFFEGNKELIEKSFLKIFMYHHTSTFFYKMIHIAVKNQKIISEIYNFFENTDIKEIFGSLTNINDLFDILHILKKNENIINIFNLLMSNYVDLELQNKNFDKIINNILREFFTIHSYFKREEMLKNLGIGCYELLSYTLLGNIKNDINKKLNNSYEYNENISEYYINKFLYDSTKDKNDILKYDYCIRTKISDDKIINKPIFMTYLIDMTQKNENSIRNGTYFEDFYFTLGFCLPQGAKSEKNKFIIDGNASYYFCEDRAYTYIMNIILSIFIHVNDKQEIISIELKNDMNDWKYFYKLIPFFIFLIPIFIYLFLKLYNVIVIKKKAKVLMVDQSRNKKVGNGDKDNDNVNIKKNEKEFKKVKIVPKWYNVLNEFFNYANNYKDLFDFDSEESRNNNIGDLIYIKGLMGISIILTIMGQLYLIFFNLPMKEFGQYQFYYLINNLLYIFPFIGLRYSPRIIFSCTGFILTYKYLTYLKRGTGFYHIFKFIFRQLYKYLILINLIFFAKFSLNFIISNFSDFTPMIKIFNKIMLSNIEFSIKSILNLFTIKSYFIDKREQIYHNLMDYYWIAFNEIFYFIFGTILISIGYVYKSRIDFFIIFLALSLYIGKIIFYYIIKRKNKYFYTTLYYYLFDFGIVMTNPLFNLSYFLIGMYFGLINYSIRKGIIDINENTKIYNQIQNDKKGNRKKTKINELIPSNNRLSHNSRFSKILNDDEDDEDEIFDDNNKSDIPRKKTFIKNQNINILFMNSIYSNDLDSEDGNILYDKNIKQNIIKGDKEVPFLKSTINIINWHRNHEIYLFFIILISFITLIIVSFISINYLFLYLYERNIENSYEENKKLPAKLSLVDFITNPILNFIYLIDTEIFVFLVQWLFFILFMKRQYAFINFFSHIYWSSFIKSYFSFLMISNLVILYNFYSNETVVKLNLYNLFLYYFINCVIILILTIIFYISIELPLKKLFKYMVKNDYIIDITKKINEEEEEEEEEDEDEDEDEEKDDENEEENENEDRHNNIKEENTRAKKDNNIH